MTDLTPNDLSYISDDEFIALCPQGEHAPGLEPLSPAAQAVWDAAWQLSPVNCESHEDRRRQQIAAALRAAAYQVAPARPRLDSCCEHYEQAIRHNLLAIAAEMEGAQ